MNEALLRRLAEAFAAHGKQLYLVGGSVRDLLLGCDELMALFGRPPGPWIKPLKEHRQNLVLDGQLQTDDKEQAIAAARAFVGEPAPSERGLNGRGPPGRRRR